MDGTCCEPYVARIGEGEGHGLLHAIEVRDNRNGALKLPR